MRSLERISRILNDEALAAEQLVSLGRFRPAAHRRDATAIARIATGICEFAKPDAAFHLTSGDEPLARFAQERRHAGDIESMATANLRLLPPTDFGEPSRARSSSLLAGDVIGRARRVMRGADPTRVLR